MTLIGDVVKVVKGIDLYYIREAGCNTDVLREGMQHMPRVGIEKTRNEVDTIC